MFPALIDAYERERHETQRLRALIRAYASHICAHEGIGYLRPADETAELTDSQFRELQIMCNGQTGLAK